MLTYWQVKITYRYVDGNKDELYNFKTKKEAVDFYNYYKVHCYENVTAYKPEKQYVLFKNEIGWAEIIKCKLTKSGLSESYSYQYCNGIGIEFPISILGDENKIADYCKNALKHYNELSNDKKHRTKYVYVLRLKEEEVFDFRTNKLIPKEDRPLSDYDEVMETLDEIIEGLRKGFGEDSEDADSQVDQEGGEK